MTEKIQQYLLDIESERNIKILWACETGSRAWGFPSIDSDFDIRLIYVHKNDWYLSLTEQKDSIELMLDNDEIDITGWELKKALNLLMKSNASLLERIQSPIVYQADSEFIDEIRIVAQKFYSKIATLNHYLSMSKKFDEELRSQENFKLKKFFYTLRSTLVCKWILEKESMPPIEFNKIYKNLDLEDNIVDRIDELIKLKSTIKESYFHTGEIQLMNLIQNYIEEAELWKEKLPSANGNSDKLNFTFRHYVAKYDH